MFIPERYEVYCNGRFVTSTNIKENAEYYASLCNGEVVENF